jgi:rhodanese-related sulfurtransferase
VDQHRSRSPLPLPAFALLAAALACSDDEGYGQPKERPEPLKHELSVASAADLLAREPGVVVLDVRGADDFTAGHLEGARNLDYPSADFDAQVKKLDRAAKYLIYCGTGRISAAAFAQMHDLGFREIYHLDGGFLAWKDAGQPVVE